MQHDYIWVEDEESPRAAVVDQRRPKTILRWMIEGSQALLELQHSIPLIVHSVLSLLDIETLMQLRAVSRSFKPLVEQAAVECLNCRFPAGLKVRALLASGQTGTPLSRTQLDGYGVAAVRLINGGSHHVASLGRRRGKRRYAELSSAHAAPATASYSMRDAVWVMQEVQWARWIRQHSINPPAPWTVQPTVLLRRKEALPRYFLTSLVWETRFGRMSGRGKDPWQVDVLDILDLVLAIHGSGAAMQKARDSSREREEWIRAASVQRKANALPTARAALEAANLSAEFHSEGKPSFTSCGVRMIWLNASAGWIATGGRQDENAGRLHDVMKSLGMRCRGTGSRCWLDGCPL